MSKLRIEIMLFPDDEVVRPVLVDVDRNEILPNQVGCQIESGPGEHPVITVQFIVDNEDVAFGPVDGDR